MYKPFQGNPIKPHVDQLMEALNLTPGDVVLHQDIAHIAGIKYPSNKYGALIQAWRKRLLRELNIDIEVSIGNGYRVLEENERVTVGVKDFRLSMRQAGRAVDRIDDADVKKLDDQHRRQRDHAVRLMQEVIQSGRKAVRQVGVSGRVVVLPRPKEKSA